MFVTVLGLIAVDCVVTVRNCGPGFRLWFGEFQTGVKQL